MATYGRTAPHCCTSAWSTSPRAKLSAALGQRCRLLPRYRALLAFCEAQTDDFGDQAVWLRRALAVAEPEGEARSEVRCSTEEMRLRLQRLRGSERPGSKISVVHLHLVK